jgi:hypothetical protein
MAKMVYNNDFSCPPQDVIDRFIVAQVKPMLNSGFFGFAHFY